MSNAPVKLIIIFFLLILYMYIIVITNIPDNMIIFEGETIKVNSLLGFKIGNAKDTVETSSSSHQTINSIGKTTMQVSLFGNLFIKNMEVDVLPRTKVIPVRKYCRSKTLYKWNISCWNV